MVVAGELEYGTADSLRNALAEVAREPSHVVLVIDLGRRDLHRLHRVSLLLQAQAALRDRSVAVGPAAAVGRVSCASST